MMKLILIMSLHTYKICKIYVVNANLGDLIILELIVFILLLILIQLLYYFNR